ncbi:hypothetical protein [Streptomyces albipurpureus]|uniref:Integral membrane protein n=1 Tax=Streptomyces albipurpureus TaxID=2897419 RepID=A0ABT0UH35_9ACTN|nr:hypothetical protein [Streptomyces sp. CWNU-1]MCM2387749.1 hypothetical protein [Streptomyces sp. CWNU-1]
MNPTDTDKTDGTPAAQPTDGKPAEQSTQEPASPETQTATSLDKSAPADQDGTAADVDAEVDSDAGDHDEDDEQGVAGSSGLLSAAAGMVATGLGVVGLSGGWAGRVAAERQTLLGQIKTPQDATMADRISALYSDAWHTTALFNGMFALLAVVIGAAVLTRPGKPTWVRAFGLAGAVLGGIGLLISIGMYFDLILPTPEAGS